MSNEAEIRADERERIAQVIEAYADEVWDLVHSSDGARIAFGHIVRIARNEGDPA